MKTPGRVRLQCQECDTFFTLPENSRKFETGEVYCPKCGSGDVDITLRISQAINK